LFVQLGVQQLPWSQTCGAAQALQASPPVPQVASELERQTRLESQQPVHWLVPHVPPHPFEAPRHLPAQLGVQQLP
jgi:hypothetical protein